MPTRKSDPHIRAVSSNMVALVLGKSRAKVIDYVRSGILPTHVGEHKYDLVACVQAYINYIKYRKQRDEDEDMKDSVLKEKYKALRLENRRRAGEVVETTEVEEAFVRAMSLIALRLEAIPGRLANELAGISDPALIRQRLRHEISDT